MTPLPLVAPSARRPAAATPLGARLAATALLALFLLLGGLWISRPGLYYDETLFIQASYPRDDVPIAYMMHIGGRPVALMQISYLGALKGWLYAPLLRVFPPSAALVRLPMLLAGAGALGFFYLFVRRAFGWQTALAALALAATDPIVLFTTRLDWGPVALQRLCLFAGCFGVLRWRQKRRLRDLFLACFALGLGVFDKATFLWLLVALALAALLLFPRAVWSGVRSRALPLAAAAFLLGSAPFVYYCWKRPGETFRQVRDTPDKYAEKLRGVQYTMQGVGLIGWFSRDPQGPPAPPPDSLARLLYAVSPREPFVETLLLPAAVFSLLLLPGLPFHPWGRGLLFALLFLLFSFAQMVPIQNAGAAHHLALLLPFPHLLVAVGFTGARARLDSWLGRPHWRRILAALLVSVFALLAAANLRAVGHHYFRILAYGGNSGWSEAIYSLHRSLDRSHPSRILLLDWGMMNQLRLLSRDRLPLVEALQPQGPTDDAAYLGSFLDDPAVLYVKPAPLEAPAFPQILAAFRRALAQRGLQAELRETVKDLRGRPVFEILAVRPAAAPPTPPRPTR